MREQIRAAPARVATRDTRAVKLPPKVRDPVYGTPEHKAWRAEIMRRSRGRCEDPACAAPYGTGRLFADHVVELRDGGAPFDVANGLVRCGACHTRKTMAERARRMAEIPEGPQ
jgi:5-methylcytosine-specific restriction protein A